MSQYRRRIALTAATFVSLAVFATGSQAAVLNGSIWEGDLSADASACVVCGGTPTLTFTSTAINYNSQVTSYTLGGFINAPTQSTILTGGSHAGDALNNTHITLTGNLFLGAGVNNFTIAHDDGVVINIAGFGNVVSAPGPTSPVTTAFSVNNPGAAGTFAYTLNYNECCGPPAVLQWQYANGQQISAVPEPSTWAMMLLGFAGLGFAFRQSRRKVSFA
jgi:PEP-CTERM motif-containing protein